MHIEKNWSYCAAGSRRVRETREKENHMLMTVLIIVVVLALVGVLPTWPHSRNWGYYPSGGVGLILLIVIVLLLMNRV